MEFLDRYSENPQIPNLIKIRPVGAQLFHADVETDMTQFCERASKSPASQHLVMWKYLRVKSNGKYYILSHCTCAANEYSVLSSVILPEDGYKP